MLVCFFFLLVEWTFSFTAKWRMICHTESQSISLFCSYNYNALMMQKQMIMEQYRNNKTLNSCFFFSVSTKVQIGCFTTSTTDWWSGLCLLKKGSTIIIYLQKIIMLHIRFVIYWLFQQYIRYTVVSKSIYHNSWVKQDTKFCWKLDEQ